MSEESESKEAPKGSHAIAACFWCNRDIGPAETSEFDLRMQSILGSEVPPKSPIRVIESCDPCPKCQEFEQLGFVTIRAIDLPEDEIERRGLTLEDGSIDLDGHAKEIWEAMHPMIWRVGDKNFVRQFSKDYKGASKFMITSIKAAALFESTGFEMKKERVS